MEENIEIIKEDLPLEPPKKKPILTFLKIVIIAIFCLCSLCGVVASIYLIQATQSQNLILSKNIEQLQNESKLYKTDFENFKKDYEIQNKAKTDEIEKNNTDMKRRTALTNLSVSLSSGLVTEKIIAQKVYMYEDPETKIISGVIDIRPQPYYSDYFLGMGKINLSDRDIKAMIVELIDNFNSYCKEAKSKYNLKFEGGTIDITTNNFNVAKYKDGKVSFSGE